MKKFFKKLEVAFSNLNILVFFRLISAKFSLNEEGRGEGRVKTNSYFLDTQVDSYISFLLFEQSTNVYSIVCNVQNPKSFLKSFLNVLLSFEYRMKI